jgi:hypothetical protein
VCGAENTDCKVEGCWSYACSGLCFRYSVVAQGPSKPTISWIPEGLFPMVKRLEREASHLFIFNTVVRNIVSCQ